MSVNHLFGNKKRNSSILYGVDQAKVTTSPLSLQRATGQRNVGNCEDGFPPSKRYKSHTGTEDKELEDPFGDNDDFTADDLEEIDIIASQALTQNTSLNVSTVEPKRNVELSSYPNSTIKTSNHIKHWNIAPKSAGQFGSRTEGTSSKGQLEALQAQYEEAERKLKEMKDEILTKTGEIKILRESMQQMESTAEEQRKSYALLEMEKAQTMSEKEKEFSRKLESLKSELQFRDAEMNELRMKLSNCERLKPVTSSMPYISPKKSPCNVSKPEECTKEKKSFPTKDSFRSELSPKSSYARTHLCVEAPPFIKDSKMPNQENELGKQETRLNIFAQRKGSTLINALLKQPVVPDSSLGLCYLLSWNADAQSGPSVLSSSFDTGPTGSTDSEEEETSLRTAQKLALMGLNLIAMDEGSLAENSEETERRISHLKRYKIPGAIHLLPLLEHHIGAYNQALLLMTKAGSHSGNQSACSSRTSSSVASSVDDNLSTLEEVALVSLGILYYLVSYSWDVLYTLLSLAMKPDTGLGAPEILEKDEAVCSKQCKVAPQEPSPDLSTANVEQSQHPLFKKLLELLALCATAAGGQRHGIMNRCLRVLVKLAEKSTVDLLISFQNLLNKQTQTLLRCLSSESPLFAVYLTVQLLTLFAQHLELAGQFCSCSETCLLLALYTYITSRPDKSASEMLWLQLEQEVLFECRKLLQPIRSRGMIFERFQELNSSITETVRLLTKCVQCCSNSLSLVGTDCQCNSEVVKALIIMMHRQWLTIRRAEGDLFDVCGKQVVRFLRDTILLLHSLSQRDKLFHEHCLEVLHLYDHVMPGVRAILRKVPDLKACEELALDELYPLEPEVEDQEIDCS